MSEIEYEYRLLKRTTSDDGSVSDWSIVYTNRGGGRPFRTLRAAKGVRTREQKDDKRWSYRSKFAHEYKIQRRPVSTDWEDIDND